MERNRNQKPTEKNVFIDISRIIKGQKYHSFSHELLRLVLNFTFFIARF